MTSTKNVDLCTKSYRKLEQKTKASVRDRKKNSTDLSYGIVQQTPGTSTFEPNQTRTEINSNSFYKIVRKTSKPGTSVRKPTRNTQMQRRLEQIRTGTDNAAALVRLCIRNRHKRQPWKVNRTKHCRNSEIERKRALKSSISYKKKTERAGVGR